MIKKSSGSGGEGACETEKGTTPVAMVHGGEGTAKYAKGAKRQAKILFNSESDFR
jgi:hypothetical protein